jgi:serine/threonine protein kinase
MKRVYTLPFTLNNYIFVQVIGDGAFGRVYKATYEAKTVAIKQIPISVVKKEKDIAQLQREIDSMAFLQHENLVALLDFFTDEKCYYLVQDYCPYGSLFHLITREGIKSGIHASKLFYQIVSGVSYCHQRGVAHRDLKSLNILLDEREHIKICDFGFCAFFSENGKMDTCCGSPCYASPELLNNIEYDAKKADIWALGVVLFELLTGKRPWNVSNIPQMIKAIISGSFKIPNNLRPAQVELIQGMLKVDPNERMTIEKVLINPWVQGGTPKRMLNIPKIPKTNPQKLCDVILGIERKDTQKEKKIISPFLELKGTSQLRMSLRSRSMETFPDISRSNSIEQIDQQQKTKINRRKSQSNFFHDYK